MFGSHAIYVDEKIVFILRHREDGKTERDNGLWVVAAIEHVHSVLAEFPALRPIEMFQDVAKPGPKAGKKIGVPTWNNLPETAPSFEEDALALCELVIAGDPRIGRVPGRKKPRSEKKKR